jgi:hypothetical protein
MAKAKNHLGVGSPKQRREQLEAGNEEHTSKRRSSAARLTFGASAGSVRGTE